MTSMDRKARHRENLRKLIISHAMELIVTEGVDRLTIRSLAAAIEYSPRTIYLYFENKNAVMDEVVEQVFAGTIQDLEQMMAREDDSGRILRRQIRRHIINGLENPELYRAVIQRTSAEDYRPVRSQILLLAMIEIIITKSAVTEDFRNYPGDVSRVLLASMRGITLLYIAENLKPDQPETKRKIRLACRQLMKGLL